MRHSDRGFTIVELVCTLAVLGVLVGVASTQFFESKTFDERITSDAISLARNAQLIALSNANVDLLFEESGSEIEVSVRVAGVKQVSRSFNKAEAMITVDGSSFGGTPGVCAVIPSAVSLQFDPKAEILGTSLGNYSQGFPVCVNGASTSLCVSTAGFPHEGSCL